MSFPEEKIYNRTTNELEKAAKNLKNALRNVEDAFVIFQQTDIKNTAITIETLNNYSDGFKAIEKVIKAGINKVNIAYTGMYQDLNRLDEFQIERKSEGWFSSLKK